MIPTHLFYQIYLSFLEQNDCTPPKCGELSEDTDSAHTEVEDPSLGEKVSQSVCVHRCFLYMCTCICMCMYKWKHPKRL